MVNQCTYCAEKPKPGVRILKTFPLHDKNLLKKWLEKLGMGPNFVPTRHSRLCSDHFSKDCVDNHDRIKFALGPNSIPILFGPRIWKFCVLCGAKANDSVYRSFHSFPLCHVDRLKEWIKATGLKGFFPTKKTFICSDHFEDDCFVNNFRNSGHLKLSAVPTIFKSKLLEGFSIQDERNNCEIDDVPPLVPFDYEGSSVVIETNVSSNNSVSATSKQIDCDDHISQENLNNIQSPLMATDNRKNVEHDHQYHTTNKLLINKIIEQEKKIEKLRCLNRVRQQHIKRLKYKIVKFKNIITKHNIKEKTMDLEDDSD